MRHIVYITHGSHTGGGAFVWFADEGYKRRAVRAVPVMTSLIWQYAHTENIYLTPCQHCMKTFVYQMAVNVFSVPLGGGGIAVTGTAETARL